MTRVQAPRRRFWMSPLTALTLPGAMRPVLFGLPALLIGCSAGDSSPSPDPTSPAITEGPTGTPDPGVSTATPTEPPSGNPTPTAGPTDTPATPTGPAEPTPTDFPTVPPDVGPNPILFATQVPFEGYGSISMPFGNHRGSIYYVPRGGDLMIRYPDGTLRNLTKEAGYGEEGLQGAKSISVREPCVHWSGKKAVFAMAMGAPTKQYELVTSYWQLYEITGLGQDETPVITKVPHQPENYNNISPIYGTDDKLIYASDRPRNGEAHLYPQLDEYEAFPVTVGLYSLDPASGALKLLNHSPSGAFHPTLDSFGRVIFTRWDHLQRDQEADTPSAQETYHPVNFPDESKGAVAGPYVPEYFPEQRTGIVGNQNPVSFNQFFPWMMQEDGMGEETLNHVGRQELGGTYTDPSFNDDANLSYYTPEGYHLNRNYLYSSAGLFQLREDPLTPGLYFGVYVQEFADGRAGQVISLEGPPNLNPDQMLLHWITDPATHSAVEEGKAPPAGHSGLYRNPVPLSDGTVIVSHTDEVYEDLNEGTTAAPAYRYDFRLKPLLPLEGYAEAGNPLIPEGIVETVDWYSPDVKVHYSGPLWELDAVEVRAQTRPKRLEATLPAPETQSLAQAGVSEETLRTWLKDHNLAIIVSRNITQRDRADVQQPYNLRVPGGVQSAPKSGKIYDVSWMQLVQADLLRAYGTNPGRRVVPQYLHDDQGQNPDWPDAPPASISIASDGSMAAFVPANRALSWQLIDTTGKPIVRERNWLTMQPGEIRTCPSCHGINTQSQTGEGEPTNPPAALKALLDTWKANNF